MSLKKKALSGIVWTFAQQFSMQIIQFIVSVAMARLLLPSEFGIVGMISVFIAIGSSLINSGLTQSLIRTENPDQEDFSTIFYFNVAGSVIIYVIAFFCAPLIADFYGQEILTPILRVYCLSFIISSFSAVQTTRLTKAMNFKLQMTIAVPSLIASGILGVILAYLDFGVWALVWSSVFQSLLNTVQLWIRTGWKPAFVFNKQKFFFHFGFGYKLMMSGLLNTIFTNIYQILIGKFFSPSQVGFYTRADALRQLPVKNIAATLNKVTYPLFASIQNDDARLKKVYKQLMQMVTFVIAPTLAVMGVMAEPLFRFLFTEKWLPAVPFFQIMCINGILYPIHSYNLNILNVKGRSDLFLRLEFIKRVLTLLTVVVTIQISITALLWGQVFTSVAAFFINSYYSGRYLKYTAWEQLKDILPILVIAAAAGAATLLLDRFFAAGLIDIARIVICSVFAALLYLSASYLIKITALDHYLALIKRK